jgi:hypothetical protein
MLVYVAWEVGYTEKRKPIVVFGSMISVQTATVFVMLHVTSAPLTQLNALYLSTWIGFTVICMWTPQVKFTIT